MGVNWEHHIAGRNRSRRFLKQLDDSFFLTGLRELTHRGALCDLLLVPREALVGEVLNGDHLGHSNHAVIKFEISVVLSAPIFFPRWTRHRLALLENQHVLLMCPWQSCYPKMCPSLWCARSQSPAEWKYLIYFQFCTERGAGWQTHKASTRTINTFPYLHILTNQLCGFSN